MKVKYLLSMDMEMGDAQGDEHKNFSLLDDLSMGMGMDMELMSTNGNPMLDSDLFSDMLDRSATMDLGTQGKSNKISRFNSMHAKMTLAGRTGKGMEEFIG